MKKKDNDEVKHAHHSVKLLTRMNSVKDIEGMDSDEEEKASRCTKANI